MQTKTKIARMMLSVKRGSKTQDKSLEFTQLANTIADKLRVQLI